MVKVVYINLFQYFYNIVKQHSLTNLLNTNKLSKEIDKRVSILSFFYKVGYREDILTDVPAELEGFRLRRSLIDDYTIAIFRDNIIMIDYDTNDLTLNDIKLQLNRHPFVYDIVKSVGGYHIFITNRLFNPKSINTLHMMASFKGADPLYAFFTYLLGTTNIRMCKKEAEKPNAPIYTFLETYTSPMARERGVRAKQEIHKVVMNHIKEADRFVNTVVKDKENSRTINLEMRFDNLEGLKNSLLDPRLLYAEVSYNIPKGKFRDINLERLKYPTQLSHHFVPIDIIEE